MTYHWSKSSDVEIEQYRISSHIHLKSIPVPSAVRCIDNTSRLKFKYAFRQCRNNDEMMRADALARLLYC